MERTFKYMLLLAATLTLSMGFVSCDDDDDDDESRAEKAVMLESVVDVYLNSVVYPTYADMSDATEELFDLIDALNTKLQAGTEATQDEIDAICSKYKEARYYWEESEAFLYGAASDFNIDPHIDTWPLELEVLASVLSNVTSVSALASTDDDTAISAARSTFTGEGELGFHGIEFIFFRDGEPRDVSVFNNDEVESYEDYFSGVSVGAKTEVIYARATAGDLRDRTYQMEVAWAGDNADSEHVSRASAIQSELGADAGLTTNLGYTYGEDLQLAGTDYSTLAAGGWAKAMEVILIDGCSNICAEVSDQKMGQAYRAYTGTGTDEDDPNYIESPYSYNSFTDFYDNIMSIHNVLYGNVDKSSYASNSIMAYLYTYNSDMAEELQDELDDALEALQACIDSGTPFVKNPGSSLVGAAMEAVNDLDNELNEVSNWILKNY